MGNRLLCDCNVRWLKDWLLKTRVGGATCYAPPRLNGVAVTQLNESDFKCSKHISLSVQFPVVCGEGKMVENLNYMKI